MSGTGDRGEGARDPVGQRPQVTRQLTAINCAPNTETQWPRRARSAQSSRRSSHRSVGVEGGEPFAGTFVTVMGSALPKVSVVVVPVAAITAAKSTVTS